MEEEPGKTLKQRIANMEFILSIPQDRLEERIRGAAAKTISIGECKYRHRYSISEARGTKRKWIQASMAHVTAHDRSLVEDLVVKSKAAQEKRLKGEKAATWDISHTCQKVKWKDLPAQYKMSNPKAWDSCTCVVLNHMTIQDHSTNLANRDCAIKLLMECTGCKEIGKGVCMHAIKCTPPIRRRKVFFLCGRCSRAVTPRVASSTVIKLPSAPGPGLLVAASVAKNAKGNLPPASVAKNTKGVMPSVGKIVTARHNYRSEKPY